MHCKRALVKFFLSALSPSFQFAVCIVVFLSEDISPVLKCLANDGGNLYVVESGAGSINLPNKLVSESPLFAAHAPPTTNLPVIIRTSAAHVEAAIPLIPAVRVYVGYPTRRFPHIEVPAALDTVLIRALVVILGCHLPLNIESLEPVFRKLLPLIAAILATSHSRCDGSKVCSAK